MPLTRLVLGFIELLMVATLSCLLLAASSCSGAPARSKTLSCEVLCDTEYFLCQQVVRSRFEMYKCARGRSDCFKCCVKESYSEERCDTMRVQFDHYYKQKGKHMAKRKMMLKKNWRRRRRKTRTKKILLRWHDYSVWMVAVSTRAKELSLLIYNVEGDDENVV